MSEVIEINGEYTNLKLRNMEDGQSIEIEFCNDGDEHEPTVGQWGLYKKIDFRYKDQEASAFIDDKLRCQVQGSNLMTEMEKYKRGDKITLTLKEIPTKYPNPAKVFTISGKMHDSHVNTDKVVKDKPKPFAEVEEVAESIETLNQDKLKELKAKLSEFEGKSSFKYENVKNTIMTNVSCSEKQAQYLWTIWFVAKKKEEDVGEIHV